MRRFEYVLIPMLMLRSLHCLLVAFMTVWVYHLTIFGANIVTLNHNAVEKRILREP